MSEQGNKGLSLELATGENVESLLTLQKAFNTYSPSEKEDYNFAYEVSNDPFSEDDFRKILARNECVLLMDGDVPVGYMLIDTCSQTNGLLEFQHAITRLIEEEILDEEYKLMPRFVEVLNPQLHQEEFNGLRWQMLAYLIYHNKEKYKGLCFTFFTNATTLIEKLNMGWKIAFDNGLYYYLVWEFSQLE